MSMQENVARMMRAFQTAENKSTAAFSEELEISRSTLQSYLNGTGNPSVSMLEHIAQKLAVDPVVLVSDAFSGERADRLLLVMQTMNALAALSEEKRKSLAELFVQIAALWEEGAR